MEFTALKDFAGCPNGHTRVFYKKGDTVELDEPVATRWVDYKLVGLEQAEKPKRAKKQTEETPE